MPDGARILTDDVIFAESPRWHAERLWFSDVHDYALKTVDLQGCVERIIDVPGRPAGLGVLPSGALLMATANERFLHEVSLTGLTSVTADLSSLATGLLNDLVVDAHGRAYVGDTGYRPADGEPFRPGCTWLVAPGAEPVVAARDMHFPNGCAISADGETLYVAETFANRISRFAIDGDGRLSDRRIHVELDSSPDGLCLDADGALWVGMILQGEFIRIDAAGEIVERVPTPLPFAVTCVFGGPDRSLLFRCSADTTLERLSRGDSRGHIDVVPMPVGGAGLP